MGVIPPNTERNAMVSAMVEGSTANSLKEVEKPWFRSGGGLLIAEFGDRN